MTLADTTANVCRPRRIDRPSSEEALCPIPCSPRPAGAAVVSSPACPPPPPPHRCRSPLYAQQKYPARIAHSEAIGSPLTVAFEKYTVLLRERSGGRIDAQHFPASQLGSYTQLIEQSRIGTIQITTGGPDTEEAVAPEIAATGGAPGFIFKDEAHVDRVLTGPIGVEVSGIARTKTGVEFVAFGEVGFRHLLSKRPVTKLEDLRGLKIRTPELRIWVDFWRKLGANPDAAAVRRAVRGAVDRRDRRRSRPTSSPSSASSGSSRRRT